MNSVATESAEKKVVMCTPIINYALKSEVAICFICSYVLFVTKSYKGRIFTAMNPRSFRKCREKAWHSQLGAALS